MYSRKQPKDTMIDGHQKKKRETSFWRILLLIAVFYFVPGIQVVTQRLDLDNAASCRINHKCTTPSGKVPALNNILSNILYVIFGCSFIYFVKYRHSMTRCNESFSSKDNNKDVEIVESKVSALPPPVPSSKKREKCGVRHENGVYYAMGLSLCLEGFFSGIYHICPTPSTVQFDFTFIIISVLLLSFALYKKRHSHLAGFESPVQFLALIATMVAMNGALQVMSGGDGSSGSCALRGVFTWLYVVIVILVGICLRRRWMLSFVLYDPRQKFQILVNDFYSWICMSSSRDSETLTIQSESEVTDQEAQLEKKRRRTMKESILDQLKGRVLILVLLLNIIIAVSMNVMCETEAAGSFEGFSIVCAGVNSSTYFIIYFLQKYLHNERLTRTAWICFASSLLLGSIAIYFFIALKDYEVFGTAEDSEKRAHKCILFDFFGPHDMWHLLSAPAVFFMYTFVLCIDDDLENIPTRSIPVF